MLIRSLFLRLLKTFLPAANHNPVYTNTIYERTAGSGVTIDSVVLKDNIVTSAAINTNPAHASSRFGTYTAGGSSTHLGYITMHDSNGNDRRMAVMSTGC